MLVEERDVMLGFKGYCETRKKVDISSLLFVVSLSSTFDGKETITHNNKTRIAIGKYTVWTSKSDKLRDDEMFLCPLNKEKQRIKEGVI